MSLGNLEKSGQLYDTQGAAVIILTHKTDADGHNHLMIENYIHDVMDGELADDDLELVALVLYIYRTPIQIPKAFYKGPESGIRIKIVQLLIIASKK